MLAHAVRASRMGFARVARQQGGVAARRGFMAPTAVRQADLVQDMYLRELKNYKAPPVKANDAEGQVQKFSVPKPPPSPEEADIAADLKAYESQAVEVEGQAEEGAEANKVDEDWFEEDEDEGSVAAH